jgi:hypothetical protein
MKVALCLHGLFNSTQDETSNGFDGYRYIKKHILDKFDTDVYIHSWQVDKIGTINELYKPKLSTYQQQIDFSDIVKERQLDTLRGVPRAPHTVLSHLYSVTESMKLAYESGKEYDLIIKARFDLGRINRRFSGPFSEYNPYPVQCINFENVIERNKIYMANWQHFNMGPADMWFYGSMEIMKPFTHLYDDLNSEFKLDSPFYHYAKTIENNPGNLSNAVAFYKYWMIRNGLWQNKTKINTIWE